jgi:hypothetical protein
VAVAHVEFHDLDAPARACVAEGHADLDRLIRSDLAWSNFQITVSKCCVAQPEAEGKLRCDVLAIEVDCWRRDTERRVESSDESQVGRWTKRKTCVESTVRFAPELGFEVTMAKAATALRIHLARTGTRV